jgi:starch-binding outer membrane protein SusE/F
MKIFLNNILILFTATIFLVSCDKEEFTVLNPDATTTVSLSVNDVILNKDNAGIDVLTVSWTDPDYGFDSGASYKIILTSADNTSKEISVGTELSKVFETVELNKILLGLGFVKDTQASVTIQIKAILSEYKVINSNSVTLTATAYEDKLDLSTIWGVVGSATVNSWDGPDMPFFTTDDSNVLVAYVTLIDGEIKFRSDNSWTLNYGDDGLDGTLEEGGANIPVTAGTYKILFNTSALTYTIEAFTWGLVGDATTNSWDGPDMPFVYDSFSDTWRAIVSLGDGEFKFRFNNDWGLNYGDDGNDGILENGGANIPVSAGNYVIIFDLNNLEYSIESIDIWGVVGSGYNDWGATPDAKFTRNWEIDDVWVLNGVTLLDGEIKFRANESWDVNYGDTGNDGTLELGGDNIPVSAGKYNIVLDFSDGDNPVYTITGS